MKTLVKKSKKETGASLVEYSLLVALISIISIAGIDTFAESVNDKLVEQKTVIANAGSSVVSGGDEEF